MADTRPTTIEIVIYDDGSAAISEFTRPMGVLEGSLPTYIGQSFLDSTQTVQILTALQGYITSPTKWYQVRDE